MRHRVEHASLLLPEVFNEILRLGLVLTVQPSFAVSDFWIVNRLGVDRVKHVYPVNSLISKGVKIAGGSVVLLKICLHFIRYILQ